ncbi:MAG: HU family DNA-binding protein [Bacteroidales bacterium]|nr:HU family DNA-binding protein [Candidatus Liminaster caballi]
MTQKEFLSELQKRSGMDRQMCSALLSATEKLMVEEATMLVPVRFEGLGEFVPTKHPEYIDQNPETGQSVLFPPRISYRFHSEVEL